MNVEELWEALDRVGFQSMRVLLSVLWQSSLLLLSAGLLALALRRRPASVRCALWAGALVVVPLLPLLGWAVSSIAAPRARIPVLPAYEPRPAEAAEAPAPSPVPDEPAPSVPPAGPIVSPAPRPPPASIPAPAEPVAPAPPPPAQQAGSASLPACPWAIGLLAYAAAAGGMLSLVVIGRLRIRRWVRGGSVVTDPRVLDVFRAAGERLGVARDVVVVQSPDAHTPMTIGVFHPVILLPVDLLRHSSADELRALALHELAHVRRGDAPLLTLLSIVRAALFFHPLVWLGCRRAASLAERACDDAVLDATGEPVAYAKMLTRLAEALRRRAPATELAAGFVLSRGAFLRRVKAIPSSRRDRIRKLCRQAT